VWGGCPGRCWERQLASSRTEWSAHGGCCSGVLQTVQMEPLAHDAVHAGASIADSCAGTSVRELGAPVAMLSDAVLCRSRAWRCPLSSYLSLLWPGPQRSRCWPRTLRVCSSRRPYRTSLCRSRARRRRGCLSLMWPGPRMTRSWLRPLRMCSSL
jgi:hypothetical protein